MTANENNEYDDLSDLTPAEMESVKEWEMQFKEKYDLVGRLLRVWCANLLIAFEYPLTADFRFQPGEQPTNYSDEEDEPNSSDKSGGEEKLITAEKPEEWKLINNAHKLHSF